MDSSAIDLSGPWRLRGAGFDVSMPIPGDVHSALLAAGEISDPYWGTNELDLQPLHGHDFVLSRSVQVPQSLLDAPALYLHFDSIDTRRHGPRQRHDSGHDGQHVRPLSPRRDGCPSCRGKRNRSAHPFGGARRHRTRRRHALRDPHERISRAITAPESRTQGAVSCGLGLGLLPHGGWSVRKELSRGGAGPDRARVHDAAFSCGYAGD